MTEIKLTPPVALEVIIPDWPAHPRIRAASTTRVGGVSEGPLAALNLGYCPADQERAVTENRQRLAQALELPATPAWLRQVHGQKIVDATTVSVQTAADGSVSKKHGTVCAVMTADCLPVLLCDQAGTQVGAIHAGWRGLAAGILVAAVTKMDAAPEQLIVWLGPAIGPQAYEVGSEVRSEFLRLGQAERDCFVPSPGGRWLADLYGLARAQLTRLGISEIHGGGFCTFSDSRRFYSYRRDGSSGRMASLIWLAGPG